MFNPFKKNESAVRVESKPSQVTVENKTPIRVEKPPPPIIKKYYHFAEIKTPGRYSFEIEVHDRLYSLVTVVNETGRKNFYSPRDNQAVKERLIGYLKSSTFTIPDIEIHNDWKVESVSSLEDLFLKLDSGCDTNFIL